MSITTFKRARATKKQIEHMVSFIETNKEMSYGNIKNVEQQRNVEIKWNELKHLLNNEEGPQRSVKQWKNVFADLKTNIRRRARNIKQDVEATRGGPPNYKPLTDTELRILNLINPVVIEGAPIIEPGLSVDLLCEKPLLMSELELINFEEINETCSNENLLETDNMEIDSTSVKNTISQMPSTSTAGTSETPSAKSKAIPRKKNRIPFRLHNEKISRQCNIQELIMSNNNVASAINNLARSIKLLKKTV